MSFFIRPNSYVKTKCGSSHISRVKMTFQSYIHFKFKT
ncbi:hypothetical protein LEP1GSC165_2980 [Leptospira santarosai str. CBC523]|nr:hypothetical protein LEP1GSC165_2980 [Leptospira santarosai str. CBC523]